MFQRGRRFGVTAFVFIILVGMAACSSPATLESRSMAEAPVVDGALDEWGGTLTYVDDQPVSISAVPTDSLLFLAVSIQDRRLTRAVAAKGLIVWVDPAGGQKHAYGIRYPLGLRGQRGPSSTPAGGASQPGSASQATIGLDDVSLSELEVLRHDSTRVRIPAHYSSGLRAKATLNRGSLVYELAIPVGGDETESHGLRASLGRSLGIGLETPEADESNIELPDRNTPSVTGRRGGRGRRTPRMGQRRQNQPARSAQGTELAELDMWTTVVTTTGK